MPNQRLMGGMWGAHVARARDRNLRFLEQMYTHADARGRLRYRTDQVILNDVMWDAVKAQLLTHDSFHCQLMPNSRPFPTKRVRGPNNFVGGRLNSTVKRHCPPACRREPSWKTC